MRPVLLRVLLLYFGAFLAAAPGGCGRSEGGSQPPVVPPGGGGPATPETGPGPVAPPSPGPGLSPPTPTPETGLAPMPPGPSPTPVLPPGAAPAPVETACIGDWRAGDYPPELTSESYLTIDGVPGQQGLSRQYKVHLPRGYDCRKPAPVVFCLHGLMQTAVSFCVRGTGFKGGTGFPDKSDLEGFILVMPNGHLNSWNGGACCGAAQSMGLDDVALMRAILAEVSTHANVDPRRVFATGLSNGGYLSYRLACEAADLFTAVAPGAGAIDGIECRPSRPVSVLDIHGTRDRFVPYRLQAPSQDAIAAANGCSSMTAPATVPASGGDTTCVTRTGCPPGVEVTACTVEGGGHDWFGDPGCGTGAGAIGCGVVGANSDFMVNTTAAWSFFRRLSR
jgi:polyhydroxybutyrate depolymerase